MEKPDVRGVSPSRKAHLVLREKLNRKSNPPPPFPVKRGDLPEPVPGSRENRK
jgi:hypothetical protein